MKRKTLLLLFSALLSFAGSAKGEQPAPKPPEYTLSAELLELFRAEMRGLMGGSQSIAAALPIADWAGIMAVSEQMRKSYVLEQKLNDSQKMELENLPERFKMLDEAFHRGTEKLAYAASRRDAQLVAFYYSRLLEECAQCHATYAQERFPGFASEPADSQQH